MNKPLHLFSLLALCLCFFACPQLSLRAQKVYVVAAGVENYPNLKSLHKAESDAKALAELYRRVTPNVILYTGRYVTREDLLRALNDQFSRAGKNDMIVFAFSGHGYEGGICPYDTRQGINGQPHNAISYDEVLAIMKKSKARNKVVLVDACYSGGFRTGSAASGSSAPSAANDMNVVMFLASRTNEVSREYGWMANGVFTHFLLAGLKGNADADRNRIITARELFDFVSDRVCKITDEAQHPVAWGHFSDNFPMMDWRKK